MEDPNDLMTVCQYDDVASAYIDKGLLDSYGIEAVVVNEIMSTMLPLTAMPFAQVRLMVRSSDLEEAICILRDRPNK